jgi:adenylate cyclase
LAEACRLFQHAAKLDPNFAQPVAAMGYTLFLQILLLYAQSPRETLEQALQLANKAIALDDKEALAHHTLGRLQALRGEYDSAIVELRTAIALNPSLALAHLGLGIALLDSGQPRAAISEFDTAIRLSPRDPLLWAFLNARAGARLFLRDYEAAVEDARNSIRHPAAAFYAHMTLVSALAHLEKHEEAKIELAKLLEIKPDFSPNAMLAAFSPLNPEAPRLHFKRMFDGLRKAGLDFPE